MPLYVACLASYYSRNLFSFQQRCTDVKFWLELYFGGGRQLVAT